MNVGSIEAILGARFNPAGFMAFDGAMKRSAANAGTFEKSSRRSTAAMDGMAASSGRAGRGAGAMKGNMAMAAVAGVGVLGYALTKAVGKAASFEAQLSSLGSVSGASGRQMDQFRQQALKAGADTKFSALEAALAQTELAKGGLSVKNIMGGGLKAALALAAAGEIELSDAASYTANAMNLFGIKGNGAVHVADALATAANATTADVGDFGMALTQGGAAAKNAGLSFDETVAALETLAAAGVKGSDAGTSLKAAMTQIAKPTEKSANLMQDLGLKFFDAKGNMKPLAEVSGMLGDKLGGLTKQQRLAAVTTIAGTDGMRALLALYDAGPKKVSAFEKGLAKEGSAAEVAAKKQDNLKGKMEQLSGSFETAQIIVGTEMLPGVMEGAETLTAKLNELAADGSLKKFGEQMGAGISAFASALPSIIGGIAAVAGAMRTISQVSSAPIAAIKMFGQALSGDFGGAAATFLGLVRTVIAGVGLMVSAMASIPGPIGAPFRAAEKQLESLDGKIQRLQDRLRGVKSEALTPFQKMKIDVVLSGDKSAAQKIAALKRIPNLPPKIQQILASDASARNKLLAIKLIRLEPKIQRIVENGSTSVRQKIAALKALGIPAKIARLLANNSNAMAGINAVLGRLGAMPASKTVTLTTNQVTNIIEKHQLVELPKVKKGRAAGRGPGRSERSLVGEGGGPELIGNPDTGQFAMTTGPAFMALAPGDYVIPTEDRYRGRAVGLMAALAADMGIPGFAKGRAAKKKPKGKGKGLGKGVPAPLDPLRLPVDDIEKAYSAAKETASKTGTSIRELGGKIKSANSAKGDTKLVGSGKNKRRVPTEPAKDARKKLPGLRAALSRAKANKRKQDAAAKQRKKELEEAKKYQERISEQEDRAELGRMDMDRGNKSGDLALYNSGKKKRADAITALRALLAEAKKHAGTAKYARELEKGIGQADLDLASDARDAYDPDSAASAAPEMLTAAEQAREDQLDAAVNLAALTETTADDQSALSAMVGFREAVLGRVQGTGRNDWIAEAASSVKSARDSLQSLTDSTAPPDPATLKRQTEEALASLYKEHGSNFERAAGARYFGSGPVGQSGGGTVINQTFPRQPDPMTWAAMTKFELEAQS